MVDNCEIDESDLELFFMYRRSSMVRIGERDFFSASASAWELRTFSSSFEFNFKHVYRTEESADTSTSVNVILAQSS